ncbi:phage tail length tape measure family protein [Phenylobacterium sp.]|uniref:phage tail length tape measure family protein n=1 Tax=Phenylobacterium sp. TaxID=1871053 RepID=UPI003919EB3B
MSSELLARLKIEGEGRAAEQAVGGVDAKLKELTESSKQLTTAQAAVSDALGKTEKELRELQALHKTGVLSTAELSGASRVLVGRLGELEAKHMRVQGQMKLTSHQTLNMGRQFADLGVMAAMGMNPLMIIVSQGPQIADIFAEAKMQGIGFKDALAGMAGQAKNLLMTYGPLIATTGALGAAVFAAVEGFNQQHQAMEAARASSLGYANAMAQAAEAVDGVAIATFKLADARKEAARQALNEEVTANRKRLNEIENPGFWGSVGRGVGTIVGTYRGMEVAREAEAIRQRNAELLAAGIKLITDTSRDAEAAYDSLLPKMRQIEEVERQRATLQDTLRGGSEALAKAGLTEAQVREAIAAADKKIQELRTSPEEKKARSEAEAAARRALKASEAEIEAADKRLQSFRDEIAAIGATAVVQRQLQLARMIQEAPLKRQRDMIRQLGEEREAALALADAWRRVEALTKQAQERTLTDLQKVQRDTQQLLNDLTDPRYPDAITVIGQAAGLAAENAEQWAVAQGNANAELVRTPQMLSEGARGIETVNERLIELLRSLDDARFGFEQFRQSVKDGDWGGALGGLIATVQGVIGAFRNGGLGGGMTAVGSVAQQVIGGRTGRAIGGGLGLAGLGMSLGGMAGTLGSALSVGGSLASVGTLGLGSALTGIAGVLGPIGLAAGALYAAAKLFNVGGKPSNHGAGYDLVTGQFSGDKRNRETEQAAKAAADAILEGQAFLKDAGIELGATVRGLVIGTRDLSQIYLTNGRTLTSATGDAAAAADAALRAVLEGATYVNDAQKSLVEGMVAAGKGFDEITAALEGYAQAQKIPQQIADAILQLTDPKAWALEELKRAQEEQRAALKAARDAGYLTAAQYDAAYADLSKLEDLQLDEVMKRFAASMEDATNLRKSVDDRILELLDPQAYQVKRVNDAIDAQRAEALKLIEAGAMGSDFLGRLEQLRSLELAALAGSIGDLTDVFEQARPRLLSWLDEMRLGPSAELSPQAAKEEALRQYEAMLARARGGDADALSGITGYADRLLSADRSATSSAQDRLALFNRVQADIAGLAGMGGGAGDQLAQLAAMRVSLTEIAKASNVQLQADLQASAEGGSRVLVSNIPALKDMYGEALTLQTDRLVAANDRTREEIVAALNDSASKMADGLAALQGAVAQGAAVTSDQLASVAGFAAQQLEAAQQLAREAQLENARLRAQR